MTHVVLAASALIATAGLEAVSWSLVIIAFGALGGVLRRRRAVVALAA